MRWDNFAKDTVGKQLVRAADSVGANIAEGGGRYHKGDVIRFCYFARGSLRETRYWLKRALQRQLLSSQTFNSLMSELIPLGKELNSYIRAQRDRTINEARVEYTTEPDDDPDNDPNQQTI
jgi:four helix bundle protein